MQCKRNKRRKRNRTRALLRPQATLRTYPPTWRKQLRTCFGTSGRRRATPSSPTSPGPTRTTSSGRLRPWTVGSTGMTRPPRSSLRPSARTTTARRPGFGCEASADRSRRPGLGSGRQSRPGVRRSGPRLAAVLPLAAHAALPRRLPHRDFFGESCPMLSNLLGNRQDLRAEGLGVLDLDPRAITEDDDAERCPHPVLFLNQQA